MSYRAAACLERLAILNPYVRISMTTCSLTDPKVPIEDRLREISPSVLQVNILFASNHSVQYQSPHCVVVTDCHLYFAAFLNNFCRQHGITVSHFFVSFLIPFGSLFTQIRLEFLGYWYWQSSFYRRSSILDCLPVR